MSIKDWSTTYPTTQDDIATVQPNLLDTTDVTRVSQIHTLRDKLQSLAREVGSNPGNQPTSPPSLRHRVATLEGSGLGTFLSLTDAPDSYYLQSGKVVKVKSDESGLEFGTGGGAGAFVDLTDGPGVILDNHVPVGVIPETGPAYLENREFAFVNLVDGAGSMTGQAGKYVRVHSGESNLEYAAGGGGAATFLDLTDTPSSYYLQAYKAVRVNGAGDALEFYTPSSLFTLLDDCPSSYVGQAGKVVKVNSGETALEFGTGGSGVDRFLAYSDDSTFSGIGTSWVTKKQFRIVFDSAKVPLKVRFVGTFWRSTGSTGLAACRMLFSGGTVTLDLGTTAVESEGSLVTGAEAVITGLSSNTLITVEVQIKLASGTGTVWVSYTDLYLLF